MKLFGNCVSVIIQVWRRGGVEMSVLRGAEGWKRLEE
jgi:hypothetical protein